jgi:hypothetical protein
MQRNPSWKANHHSYCQNVPCLLWNSKVYYYIHESSSLRSNLTLSSHLCLGVSRSMFQGMWLIGVLEMAVVHFMYGLADVNTREACHVYQQ